MTTRFVMEITQGEDYEVTFSVTNPANNQPIDVTVGYTFTGQVGDEYFSANPPLYEWKLSNNNVVLGNGFVKVKVPAADSRAWTFRRVFYDIEVKNNVTQQEVVVATGPLIVTPTFARTS